MRVINAEAGRSQPTDVDLERAVIEFLVHEARLIDEAKFDQWLGLWAHDGIYWVPANGGQTDYKRRVSILYDDHTRLEERVYRLTHADAHSQEPPSRLTHLMSNFEVALDGDGEIAAHCSMLVVEVRRGCQEVYAGRCDYRLRGRADGFEMVSKRFVTTRDDMPLGNLTFVF